MEAPRLPQRYHSPSDNSCHTAYRLQQLSTNYPTHTSSFLQSLTLFRPNPIPTFLYPFSFTANLTSWPSFASLWARSIEAHSLDITRILTFCPVALRALSSFDP